ncbi:MAG TPA: serine hydrolase domain-containing protein [Vicinamibacterales bacterium]|nr:serine hydrolase domain-containing protein [Vicinamibacterales bacterium]
MRHTCRLSLTLSAALALLAAAPMAQSAAPPSSSMRPLRIDAGRLARLDPVLQEFVDKNQIAGAVALVLQDGKPVYDKAFGWRDKEAGVKMTTDSLFRIASQTKAITSVAVLMLMEEGRIGLMDPVSRFIPAYEKTKVITRLEDGGTQVRPAKRPIAIKDLLTHTAGISYGVSEEVGEMYESKALGPAAGYGWYLADKDEPVCDSMERLASLPFVAQPGEAWVYGYNTDILGCVVERASGMPLDRFFQTRIFEPLGMKDTFFFVPQDKKDRLVTVYANTRDDLLVRAPDGARGQGHYVNGPRRNFAGGAGLVSTARDYTRFLEMVRGDGVIGDVRLLAPRTVALMTHNQSGMLHGVDLGFSLAFETTEHVGGNGLDPVGAYGWGGAYGSVYRVDPSARLVLALMLNQLPNFTDIRSKFQTLVHQAIVY